MDTCGCFHIFMTDFMLLLCSDKALDSEAIILLQQALHTLE